MTDKLFDIALSFLYSKRQRASRALLDHYGSAEQVWRHIDEPGMTEAMLRAKKEVEWIEAHNIRVWTLEDEDYPYLLRQCPDKPIVLYSKGNIRFNEGHFVSIVGTRQATERGKAITRDIVLELANNLPNLTIISGLAYGIDIAAHRAALEAGIPTLIVPAHGLDRIYPPLHRPEAVRALANGGLITEYPSGTTPEKFNFVARNRIIAGLAECTIIVESRARGGALITASMAFDYDRPVFAVPGRINDDNAAGCNALIHDQRASLLRNPDDLIQSMMWTTASRPVQTELTGLSDPHDDSSLNEKQQTLLNLLRDADNGIMVNELVEETDISYSEVITNLMMMEMNKRVKSLPGGKFMAL